MEMLPCDSDWESSSDSGSSYNNEEHEFLCPRHANSLLSSLEETIGKIDEFLFFKREFTRGDIVHSVSDPLGQMGRVINVKLFVDLENVNGKIIKDVNSNKLVKTRQISEGDYVVHGPWIGRVTKVVDKVCVLFDDGTKGELIATDHQKLMPLSPNLLEDSDFSYYPGQRVQVRHSTVSKSAKWLCGLWKENNDVGTVSEVKAGQVDVYWFACILAGCQSFPTPDSSQDAENIILLPSNSHENWQLGDWCILPNSGCLSMKEKILSKGSFRELIEEHRNLGKGFERQDCQSNLHEIFRLLGIKTIVDVVWQDGDCSLGLDSESLLPTESINAHEFWPGQLVLEKGTCDGPLVCCNQKWGVVCEVDAKEHTVKVKWTPNRENQENDLGRCQMEIVSAYELVEHPDYTFCYGDIVFKNPDLADKCPVKSETFLDEDMGSSFKDRNTEQISCLHKGFLSCIGCVTGFKISAIEVTWASGVRTEEAPNVIFRVNKYDGSNSTNDQEDEDLNQDRIDHEKQMSSIKAKEKDVAEDLDIYTEMQYIVEGEVQSYERKSLKDAAKHFQEKEENKSSLAGMSSRQFKQFDMVSDCTNHHFLDVIAKGLTLSQVKRGWLKRVQQEWNILEKDLPESIYVRIYEERMDLLRAAIVGAAGTPYHDGLFFFDIYLPPEYPHEPPLVHYRSGGLRVNPNLYESGRVCLSLLNTWKGMGTEVWNPERSSILQVLLSLQALVLNEKPYFNEAGYDKQMGRAEGEKNAVSYNENAFLMTWKSMLYLLQQPPEHFEPLIEEHIRQRSEYILLACKAYLEGALVTRSFECGQTENEDQKGSSIGFKIMMAKLFPRLVEAFSDKGIDCSQFTQL